MEKIIKKRKIQGMSSAEDIFNNYFDDDSAITAFDEAQKRQKKIDEFCKIDKVFIPTFDFGHINCTMQGALKEKKDFIKILQYAIDNLGYEKIKNKVAKVFREILSIDSGETVYFKDNKQSLMDKSTLRNAETYSFKRQRKFTYN